MLEIIVPGVEIYDEDTNTFIATKDAKLTLEHSLISLSKWESKFKKPFLSSEKTPEETLEYIKCMTITQNIDETVYYRLSKSNIDEITKYIEDPMSATKVNYKNGKTKGGEIITAEIIYYWMVTLNIPVEFQKWHLNKLLTLIEVCSIKNQPKKNMTKSEILRSNRELNAARRAKYKTKG